MIKFILGAILGGWFAIFALAVMIGSAMEEHHDD